MEIALGPAAASFGALYTDVLLGSVVHELALVRAFVRNPVSIDFVETWPDDRWPPSVEIAGGLSSDARLSIRWHYLGDHPVYREDVSLHFEGGSLALAFASPFQLNAHTTLTVCSSGGGNERIDHVPPSIGAFGAQLSDFHRLVTIGGPSLVHARQGRADIVTCQRIVKALAERRGVNVGGEAAQA